MENEDLFYKIKQLAHTHDDSDEEWDPGKHWDLFEARKRKRHRWVMTAYAMAAMFILTVGYGFFSADKTDRLIKRKSFAEFDR